VRENRPGVKYVDPESTDTGETEFGTASVAPRIADVYPEPSGTGATEAYSRGHDSRSGRTTTLPTTTPPASSSAQVPKNRTRAEYVDPESSDTGETESYAAAHRSAFVDPESTDTGETKGASTSGGIRPVRTKPPTAYATVAGGIAPLRDDSGQPLCVLYLFSGQSERADGIPMYLRAVGFTVDAVDLVNTDLQDMDLLDDAVWNRYRRRLRAGQYHFVFASPPCRTFSECRTAPGGPPVLRSWEFIHGFPKSQSRDRRLQPHHHELLRSDNLFAEQVAEACEIQWDLGRGFGVEQPWPWQGSPGMFDLPCFKRLRRKGAISVVFDQCMHGGESRKPTEILFHKARFDILEASCDHMPQWHKAESGAWAWTPHPPVVGARDARGDFVTKRLAAYPGQLNREIASVIACQFTVDAS
jgi:hypothetical protein